MIKKIYQNEMFNPKFLGLFFNPFYFTRRGLISAVKKNAHLIKGDIVDIGCGSKPYKSFFEHTSYVGIEYDTPENRQYKTAEYFYDGNTFPIESKQFTSAVATEVFEHVFNPDEFLSEVNRVLKKEGTFLMTVPFMWDEHEQPYDYARYTSFGLKSILNKHGFEVISQVKTMNNAVAILQLWNEFIYKLFHSRSGILNSICTFLFIMPFNLIGLLLWLISPRSKDMYLNNVIIAKKIKDV